MMIKNKILKDFQMNTRCCECGKRLYFQRKQVYTLKNSGKIVCKKCGDEIVNELNQLITK